MVLTKKEEVEQFKRDLKSLNYYKSKRDELSDKRLVLERIMHEPKANRYDEITGSRKYNYIELMEKEDELNMQIQLYDALIKTIGNRLDKIEKESDRDLLVELYIRNNTYEKLALEYFMSVRKMKYYVNSVISKIM